MKSKSYSIEFTGISGVGKSTIIEEVCRLLNESEIVYDNLTKIKTSKANLRHMFPILKACYLALLVKPKSLKDFITTIKGLAIHQIIYKSIDEEKKLRVFDEGFIHKTRFISRFRSFRKNTKMINLINKLSKYNKLPDMIIIIEADSSLIMKRRIKRNRKNNKFNYESIIIEGKDEDFENTIELLANGKNKQAQKIEVVRLDNINESDILTNANKIVDIINKHLLI